MGCSIKQITPCSGRITAGFCNKHYLQIKRGGSTKLSGRDKRGYELRDGLVYIPLGVAAKNGYAVVDPEYAYLAVDNWRITHYGYAVRSKDKKLLHRLIKDPASGLVVDHIDGNKLNNILANLRTCHQSQNSMNQKVRHNSPYGYKGVSKCGKKFVARLKHNYRTVHLGVYPTALEASKAYDVAARKLHGEFARLNHAI